MWLFAFLHVYPRFFCDTDLFVVAEIILIFEECKYKYLFIRK